jgi:Fic family protein
MKMDEYSKLIRQNEIIISLLGRMAFTQDEVRNIVTLKKRNPESYVDGYNACDGNNSVSEIAQIVGVSQPTISPILGHWEELGIIYEVDKPKGKFYKKMFTI